MIPLRGWSAGRQQHQPAGVAADQPAPTRRLTRAQYYSLYTKYIAYAPPRPNVTQLLVPIDHLSQHVGDMHDDHILALGDQKLLRKLAPDQMSEAMLSQDITEPVCLDLLSMTFMACCIP